VRLIPTEDRPAFDVDASTRTIRRGPNGERVCFLDGCGGLHRCKGLCGMHHRRWTRWGDPHLMDPRYLRRADPLKPKPKPRKRIGRPPKPKPVPVQREPIDLDRLAATVPAEGWAADAACRDRVPTADYYPEGSTLSTVALATCEVCPVRYDCLAAALYDEHGIWGGTNGRERKRIRRRLRDRGAA
jgi:hypothetical protein